MNYPYIRNSKKYYGKFEVVVNEKHVIPCHNIATAQSICKELLENIKC
jgi:hypothetical protein